MTGKIRGLPQTPGVVRIKGSHMSYYSPFYQRWITKSWPKGNGGDTPRRAAARAAFIDATQKIKSAAPEMWQAAEEWAKNSPYLARDVLMASAMGTFSEITMADGTTKVSLRVTNRTIQQLLDSIGFQPGTLLARTADEWQALLPGDAGDVLTMDPSTGLPDWAPPSGGGGGGSQLIAQPEIRAIGNGAWAANDIILTPVFLQSGAKIHGIGCYPAATNAAISWSVGIYAGTLTTVTGLLVTEAATPGWLKDVPNIHELATPLPIVTDGLYWVGVWANASTAIWGQTCRQAFWSQAGGVWPNPGAAPSFNNNGAAIFAVVEPPAA